MYKFRDNLPSQKMLLMVCAVAHAVITCTFALTRLYTYKTSLLDNGVFDQLLWNIIHHGTPLFTIAPPFIPQNWFGFHFSPVLYLLVPFYAVWPHVELLQIVQSLCFGFAGVVLFYALKAAGAKDREAWIGSALYWLNPFVISAAIWDFHEIAFATLFIAVALWGLCAKRFTLMLLALILLLLTKEHYGLSVAGFGFLWGWRYGEWKRGTVLMVFGITTLITLLAFVIPAIHGGAHFMWVHTNHTDRYSWMSEPWPHKIKTLYHLFFEGGGNDPGLLYIALLLMSGLLLPLAAPFYLAPASADLLANLLTTNPLPRGMAAYHSAPLIPIILVSAYQGYRWCEQTSLRRKDLYRCAMITLAVIMSAAGPLIPLSAWQLSSITLSPDRSAIADIQALLPEGPVSAQCNIGMFFSARDSIYPFPARIDQSSAVILQLYNPDSGGRLPHFREFYCAPFFEYSDLLHAFMHQPGWHVAYWQAPWLLMLRGPAARDEGPVRADIAKHIEELDINDPGAGLRATSTHDQ